MVPSKDLATPVTPHWTGIVANIVALGSGSESLATPNANPNANPNGTRLRGVTLVYAGVRKRAVKQKRVRVVFSRDLFRQPIYTHRGPKWVCGASYVQTGKRNRTDRHH